MSNIRLNLVPPIKAAGAFVACIALLAYVGSYFWPLYSWGLRLASADEKYDLVVLLGDRAAFDDFSYHIYVFPRQIAPHEKRFNERVWFGGIWRSKRYLVYAGYTLPKFRWTGPKSVVIDVNPSSTDPASVWTFNPVLESGVVVSLVFGADSDQNHSPFEQSPKMPNQALEPTRPAVTPFAYAKVAPAGRVAHLER